FHYSKIENIPKDAKFGYRLREGRGIIDGKDGILINGNSLAAYMHLLFRGNKLADSLVEACYRRSRG
ncbi:MAG: hypothetical protein MN733_03670, partial [Nitrososphaera sp.]|nr:hypothetical protein [Nitrososphaera sp.]